MLTGVAWPLLLTAGAGAGVVSTAGGMASLVSYPALLAAGVAPLSASVANLVALTACWPGSALASRGELRQSPPPWWLVLSVAAVCGALGSFLLVATPQAVFVRLVPFLIATASVALAMQPALLARRGDKLVGWRPDTVVLIGVLSIYSGYFGAGSGIMLLAVLLVLVDPRLPQANAVKNMLIGAAAVASAAVFIISGPVDWTAVVPLAVGLFVGSLAGPVIAREVPAGVVRWTVALLGLVLAMELWTSAG
jgi:uncharacterized protein